MKLTVLIIGPTPPPYMGPSVATRQILESNLNAQFNLLHLDTSDRRSLTHIGKLDLRNIYLALFHTLKLFVLLVKFSPRIVYLPICQTVSGYLRDTTFIVLSKIFGARVVIHLRGGYFREFYKKSNILVKFVIFYSCKSVSHAIVLGESLRYIFEGLIPSERIAVVSNGIDKNYITETELNNARRNPMTKSPNDSMTNLIHKYQILFLSNLTINKGYFDVIKAIPEVLHHNQDIEFIFAGQFWDTEKIRQEVKRYLNEHKLSDHVNFAGKIIGKAKKDLLLSSDIFVLPTYYLFEGQPWVIVEAMAAGLPIITTDQGCIKEMVVNGENGFIVEKKNPEQIAEKVIYLLKNEKVRREMGKKSRERFLKYYTKDRFIDGLSRVFDEVLAET